MRITISGPSVMLLVAVLLSSAGCTRAPQPLDFGTPEGKEVARLIIEDLQESVDQPKVLQSRIFVAGAAPTGESLKRFCENRYDVVGNPSVAGTEATAKIRVRNAEDSKDVGVVEWTFTQVMLGSGESSPPRCHSPRSPMPAVRSNPILTETTPSNPRANPFVRLPGPYPANANINSK